MNLEGGSWPKIVALVALTIVLMRAFSWSLAVVARRARLGTRASAVAGNGVAFAAFVAYLLLDLEPGEPPDWAAVAFGGVVFGLLLALDLLLARRGSSRRVTCG